MASGADSLCDRGAADLKLSFAPKAILQSIAEEQRETPAPRDFATDERPADNEPAEARSPAAEEAAVTSRKETKAESETSAEVSAGRTLH